MTYNWRYRQRNRILLTAFVGGPAFLLVFFGLVIITKGWFLVALGIALLILLAIAFLNPRGHK